VTLEPRLLHRGATARRLSLRVDKLPRMLEGLGTARHISQAVEINAAACRLILHGRLFCSYSTQAILR
jgi:hypothetical protein